MKSRIAVFFKFLVNCSNYSGRTITKTHDNSYVIQNRYQFNGYEPSEPQDMYLMHTQIHVIKNQMLGEILSVQIMYFVAS